MTPIPEIDGTELSEPAIRSGCRSPGVLRGIASHWPIVAAARDGPEAVLDYLCNLRGDEVQFSHADPQVCGRFHYLGDMRGFTFRRERLPWLEFLHLLGEQETRPEPSAIAAQGLLAAQTCPDFEARNPLPLRPGSGEVRLWIGNRAQVAAHFDPADNIAYCAAGERRFTLFPPDQLPNLYLGPFDPTPAGTPIAMTDPLAPDLERFPRFAEALDAAMVVDLLPGEAVYIPYGWFHHVEARSPVSILVNYWWRQPEPGGSPWDALLHAMMAIRPLDPDARRLWRAMFDAFAFEPDGPAGQHLPQHARGVLDARSPDQLMAMRKALLNNLARGTNG